MSRLRFKVGDLAVFMFARGADGVPFQGETVEVIDIGPWKAGDQWRNTRCRFDLDSDYVVLTACGKAGQCVDYQLRKIDPPAEPESLIYREEVEA